MLPERGLSLLPRGLSLNHYALDFILIDRPRKIICAMGPSLPIPPT